MEEIEQKALAPSEDISAAPSIASKSERSQHPCIRSLSPTLKNAGIARDLEVIAPLPSARTGILRAQQLEQKIRDTPIDGLRGLRGPNVGAKIEEIRRLQSEIFSRQCEMFPQVGRMSFSDASKSYDDIFQAFERRDGKMGELVGILEKLANKVQGIEDK